MDISGVLKGRGTSIFQYVLSMSSPYCGPRCSCRRKGRASQAAPRHPSARSFHFKEGLGQSGLGVGACCPRRYFQSLPPSGVSKDRTEPCLVFDQIWWYLSRSSRPSQLLSYAVETCPAQINLVTFRSLSSPCPPPPLTSSGKWPRLALGKTRQRSLPTHSSSGAYTPHPPRPSHPCVPPRERTCYLLTFT